MSTSAAAPLTAGETALRAPSRAPQIVFGATILASSCLLFLVQPLISKLILPWFGGSAAVWITCLLFFQTALLAGYLYAHLLTRHLPPFRQAVTHAVLILLSLATLPILPNAFWEPKPGEDPTWKVFAVLATSVGLPYVLLSSTSPLLQSWYASRASGGLPYRYFALSNAGSMAALLLYPVTFEPFLKGHSQAWVWSSAYFFFSLLCIGAARLAAATPGHSESPTVPTATLPLRRVAVWIGLAACASTLLLTVTNLLTQNIAPMPLLWVVPLGIYLLSFILCFESDKWYQRRLFFPALPFALWWLASHTETIESVDVKRVVPLICLSLFVCCMVCHGELARFRPASKGLTGFYLSIAGGGALGGVIVALLAPHLLSAMYEYPISYLACAVIVLLIMHRERHTWPKGLKGQIADSLWLLAAVATVFLAIFGAREMWAELHNAVAKGRNFYGTLLVEDYKDEEHNVRQLSHGTITHGVQIVDANFRHVPTTYYGRESGAGLSWRVLERQGALKLGVIGLGAGTMAAYGRGGDSIRFYDLNPLVIDFARRYFTFLSDCPAHVDVVLGDARLSMARETSQQFDMLVVDAFAGDAIPVHLLTRQAFDIYWRHLKPGGVLAVHVSNQYLDLAPIVSLDAKARQLAAWRVENDTDDSISVDSATYILVSARRAFFTDPLLANRLKTIPVPAKLKPWSDDFTSLWPILKIGVPREH